MSLNINSIGIINPSLFQLTPTPDMKQIENLIIETNSNKETTNLTDMSSSIKNCAQAHDTKTADLTNIKEDATTLAGGLIKNPTTVGLLTTILERTVGVPSVADADKIIADTLKNVKDPSLVKNVESAWDDWKKNYYKNGNISNGEAFKAGINLVPTMGRGICNGILETGAKVVQDVLGKDGAQAVSNAVNTLANTIKTVGDTVVAPFSGLINIIKGDKKAANKAFSKVWEDVKNTGKSIKNTLVTVGKYAAETVKNFTQKPLTTTVELAKRVGKGIKTTVESVGGVAKTIGKGVKKLWKKIFG